MNPWIYADLDTIIDSYSEPPEKIMQRIQEES